MSFRPEVGDKLDINGIIYEITENPAAPGMPYGQEGRQAVVYKIAVTTRGKSNVLSTDCKAIKVFKAQHRVPGMVSLAEKLSRFAVVPGLQVCSRLVLTPRNSEKLLLEHNDLVYSVLMPWVEGPTWMEVMLGQMTLSKNQCLNLAYAFADMLSYMEEYGVAHCDLSAPNVIIPMLSGNPTSLNPVCLVDVEHFFEPGIPNPEPVPNGPTGYTYKDTVSGYRNANADRFAGALILAEMLCWCDEHIRKKAWGESYFEPGEVKNKSSPRYILMRQTLERHWGNAVSEFFDRAWQSNSLSECATFAEWLMAVKQLYFQNSDSDKYYQNKTPVLENGDLDEIIVNEQPTNVSSYFISISDCEIPESDN